MFNTFNVSFTVGCHDSCDSAALVLLATHAACYKDPYLSLHLRLLVPGEEQNQWTIIAPSNDELCEWRKIPAL